MVVGDSAIIPHAMKASTLANGAETRAAEAEARRADYDGLTRDDLLAAYRTDAPVAEDRRQGDPAQEPDRKAFFQISGAGHEAVLVAAGRQLRAGLRLVLPLLSRPRALPGARRHAARDVPGRGGLERRPGERRPPDAVALGQTRALNIPSQSSSMGTQCLHAVGCAEAGLHLRPRPPDSRSRRAVPARPGHLRVDRRGRARAKASSGKSLNTACTRKLPVLYLVEDNGYAISVPGGSADARRRHLAAGRGHSPACACSAATAPTTSTAIARCERRSRTFAAGRGRCSCTPR